MDSLNNPKHFWSYSRSKTNMKENVTKLRTPEGTLTKDDKETAHIMNEAFNGMFIQEDMSIPIPIPDDPPTEDEITTIRFDEDVVRQHLSKLDASKATGPDGVSPFVLKTCTSLLHRPLTQIFQSSMDTGEVPADWRRANITPIYKKGNKAQPLNHRPVSLTSVVSLIRQDIMLHLTTNELIRDTQHSFRAKHSCVTNLLTYLDDIVNVIDNRENVDINYQECEKALN